MIHDKTTNLFSDRTIHILYCMVGFHILCTIFGIIIGGLLQFAPKDYLVNTSFVLGTVAMGSYFVLILCLL